jgi:hypothetical protein
MTTTMTKTRLSALALSVAAFTTITLLANGSASANELQTLPGHATVGTKQGHPVGGALPPSPPTVGTKQGFPVGSPLPPSPPTVGTKQGFPVGSPLLPSPPTVGTKQGYPVGSPLPPTSPPPKISCGLPCTTPPDRDGDHDRDHDHDHDHDRDRDHDHDHDHGYDRDHGGYGWGYQPEIVVGGVPSAVVVPAPVQAVPARVSVPATQVVEGPCNCLTKQRLPDGSVLFQDICTKESAVLAAQAIGGR